MTHQLAARDPVPCIKWSKEKATNAERLPFSHPANHQRLPVHFSWGKPGFRTSQHAASVQRLKQAAPKVPFGEEGSQIDGKT